MSRRCTNDQPECCSGVKLVAGQWVAEVCSANTLLQEFCLNLWYDRVRQAYIVWAVPDFLCAKEPWMQESERSTQDCNKTLTTICKPLLSLGDPVPIRPVTKIIHLLHLVPDLLQIGSLWICLRQENRLNVLLSALWQYQVKNPDLVGFVGWG